jgi:hypothetical protein
MVTSETIPSWVRYYYNFLLEASRVALLCSVSIGLVADSPDAQNIVYKGCVLPVKRRYLQLLLWLKE